MTVTTSVLQSYGKKRFSQSVNTARYSYISPKVLSLTQLMLYLALTSPILAVVGIYIMLIMAQNKLLEVQLGLLGKCKQFKRNGGQKKHKGNTLRMAETPEKWRRCIR